MEGCHDVLAAHPESSASVVPTPNAANAARQLAFIKCISLPIEKTGVYGLFVLFTRQFHYKKICSMCEQQSSCVTNMTKINPCVKQNSFHIPLKKLFTAFFSISKNVKTVLILKCCSKHTLVLKKKNKIPNLHGLNICLLNNGLLK